jgi:hypothetical protein
MVVLFTNYTLSNPYLYGHILLSRVILVKYFGLLSEVIANVGFRGNSLGANPEIQLALGILTFIFGLFEGGISCWESRVMEISGRPGDAMTEQV